MHRLAFLATTPSGAIIHKKRPAFVFCLKNKGKNQATRYNFQTNSNNQFSNTQVV